MEDFIQRYYLDKDDLYICDEVIQFFKDSKEHHIKGQFSSNASDVVDLEVKESTDIQKDFQFFYTAEPTKKLLDILPEKVEHYTKKYRELWTSNWRILPEMKLQGYKPPNGGFKEYHCERNSPNHVCFVWMFYLNTVNDGGETEFKYQKHFEKAEKGKLLIWPSDFTHTHRGIPSPTEEKYIFTGWYEFT